MPVLLNSVNWSSVVKLSTTHWLTRAAWCSGSWVPCKLDCYMIIQLVALCCMQWLQPVRNLVFWDQTLAPGTTSLTWARHCCMQAMQHCTTSQNANVNDFMEQQTLLWIQANHYGNNCVYKAIQIHYSIYMPHTTTLEQLRMYNIYMHMYVCGSKYYI